MSRKLKLLPAKGLIVVIVLFLVWMLFLDQNNWMKQSKLTKELHEAQTKENYYKDQIRSDSLGLIELFSNDETLEKLAREKYLMKKDDETVYLIVRTGEKSQVRNVQ